VDKKYALIWVHSGIIYTVRLFDDPEMAIEIGKKIAREEGYDEGEDCIDVFELRHGENSFGDVAYWQYRDR